MICTCSFEIPEEQAIKLIETFTSIRDSYKEGTSFELSYQDFCNLFMQNALKSTIDLIHLQVVKKEFQKASAPLTAHAFQ